MENNGDGSSSKIHEFQGYQEEEQQQQQYNNNNMSNHIGGGGGGQGFVFPDEAAAAAAIGVVGAGGSVASSSILPWPLPPIHPLNSTQFAPSNLVRDQNQGQFFPSLPPLPPPPPPSSPFYGDLYARRATTALQFAYGGAGLGSSSDPSGLGGLYMGMGSEALARGGGVSPLSAFGGLHAELGKLTPQEIMDAKALAASKSHSEAERRRRERINAHLAKLRSLLPNTTKTDKASLLAEVIQHVKELKRQTLEIAEESPLPTESDELTVDAGSDEDGRFIVKASLCCDDRSDLLPDLIKALKALRLRTLKAEITTLGGRVKNVLVITGEDDADHQQQQQQQQSIASIQEALKAVMERAAASDEPSSAGGIKRQRTTNLSTILEHR
ncbi:transcription factor bHLH30-like isoform X2 [Phoenix dactylifera]|uniref:Transcription factor bHLH30-like isoform X2 n=1 Tax=Phoenix dactylifera TaxID=42345 RepID=A0A8B9APU0_PHODC|nr:transcription factor bHLH30-like isoform X2 [Phoenix dactylifera]